MPPRFLTLAIIACWAAMNGWFFYRELWPTLRSGEPPPFTIDLDDEVKKNAPHVGWTITENGHEICDAETWVRYREEDNTFELYGQVPSNNSKWPAPEGTFTLKDLSLRMMSMKGIYRVTREGDLLEVDVTLGFYAAKPAKEATIEAHIAGPVDGGRFFPRWVITMNAGDVKKTISRDQALAPVPVAPRGCLLNPLQPMVRISGLREGQRWQTPLSDPVADALAASFPFLTLTSGPRTMDAEVLKGAHMLKWNDRYVPCLKIAYHGTDLHRELSAATWVRRSDGRVLRQDTQADGRELRLIRKGD